MLARTPVTQASSEFFAGKPAAADDPLLWQHVEQARPIECPDQDEGYFDMIMRYRPIRRCTSRILR
jgi:hypothetical protein